MHVVEHSLACRPCQVELHFSHVDTGEKAAIGEGRSWADQRTDWWPIGKRSPGDGGGDVVMSGIIQGLWPDGGIGGGWVALGPGWSRTASSVIHTDWGQIYPN